MNTENKLNTEMVKLRDQYHEMMDAVALIEVERLARIVLNKVKIAHEFCMAMGSFSFSDINGEVIWDHLMEGYSTYMDLRNFIYRWDDELKLTGNPMKFTLNSEVITDW